MANQGRSNEQERARREETREQQAEQEDAQAIRVVAREQESREESRVAQEGKEKVEAQATNERERSPSELAAEQRKEEEAKLAEGSVHVYGVMVNAQVEGKDINEVLHKLAAYFGAGEDGKDDVFLAGADIDITSQDDGGGRYRPLAKE